VVTVTLPALANLKAHSVDDHGKRTGEASVKAGPADSFVLTMKANTRIEFSP
jgi:hypothetical protein